MGASANDVVQRVLRKAVGDPTYRSILLSHPTEVMRYELARGSVPVPDIRFEVVEETDDVWVVRVPISHEERVAQAALSPLFHFVDSAGPKEIEAFVRDPKPRLEKLFGVTLEEGVRYDVRIESPGVRVLVIPHDDFEAIAPGAGAPVPVEAKKKKKGCGGTLCPKGVTVDVCPKGNTVVLCPQGVTVDLCPAGCTFTETCGCTNSCTENTDTGDFPTIIHLSSGTNDRSGPGAKKISDLID